MDRDHSSLPKEGLAPMEVMQLRLEDVEPDLDQPRKVFSKDTQEDLEASLVRWGQLQPIRVRKDSDGASVIVDGERRWRALRTLAAKHPTDKRFQIIRAFVDDVDVVDEKNRKAVQLLSNQTAELMPTERASVIQAIRGQGRKPLTDETYERQFGISKRQIRYLNALANAPQFIRDLGLPRVVEVAKTAIGEERSNDGGPIVREAVEKPALGLSLLVELIAAHAKLRRYDDERFKERHGAHVRVADKTIEKMGERAQREEWSRVELKKRIAQTLGSITEPPGTKSPKARGASLRNLAKRWATEFDRVDVDGTPVEEWRDAYASLKAVMARIESRAQRGPLPTQSLPTRASGPTPSQKTG